MCRTESHSDLDQILPPSLRTSHYFELAVEDFPGQPIVALVNDTSCPACGCYRRKTSMPFTDTTMVVNIGHA